MNKENCALKLVDEIILYFDARSKKHQLTLNVLKVFPYWDLQLPWLVSIHLHKSFRTSTLYYLWLYTFNIPCGLKPVTYVIEATLSSFCVCYDTSVSAIQFHYQCRCIIIKVINNYSVTKKMVKYYINLPTWIRSCLVRHILLTSVIYLVPSIPLCWWLLLVRMTVKHNNVY